MEQLNPNDRRFLETLAKRGRLFLAFSIAGFIAALLILIVETMVVHRMDGIRAVLIVMILLVSRLNFRQYRIATVLAKITPQNHPETLPIS